MIDTWRLLQDRNRWKAIAVRFPKFDCEFPRLVQVLYECFERSVNFTEPQMAIFGLGRLAVEDFL